MTNRFTLRRPDDMHLHLRDGAMLTAVLPETARHFARAIIMPNLVPPVVTGADDTDAPATADDPDGGAGAGATDDEDGSELAGSAGPDGAAATGGEARR